MDKFIVSARKYRPQEFNTVVGQSHITTTLKNAIKNNQLAHAFLFCGPRGVGKTTCARILAKTINCTNLQPNGEACDKCESCKSFNDGASLNIHELDAASNNSVDDIRSLVEQVRFAPQAGKYKIYIVDEVHMLSASAFNAFLKTLEEPPSYAIFILATTEKHKILPTILSRCQIFDFKRITTNDTVEHLQEIIDKEEIKADKASLQIIAQKSEGCMRDALSILDKIVSFANGEVTYQTTIEHLNILDHDYYFKLLDFLQQQDMAGAMLLYDEVNRKGFEGDTVLNGFAEFLRNILVCKDVRAAQLLDVVEGMQEKYFKAATLASTAYLVSALNILNEAELNFKSARNKKLHIELAIIKLNFLQQAIELSTNENGTIVKKKRVDGAVAIKFSPIKNIAPKLEVRSTKHEVSDKLEVLPSGGVLKIETNEKQETRNGINEKQETRNFPQTPNPKSQSYPPPNNVPSKGKLLDILRQKAGDKYTVEEIKEAEPLSFDKLNSCINEYIEVLQKAGGKTSTVNTFKMARLDIENDIHFKFYVSTITGQRAIEQEKLMLADLLQQAFSNPAITFLVMVDESEEEIVAPMVTLNRKERFELIASQYPLVRVLKDRLKLEIDY
jgi:DNA polymerase-3 subunit gamma/tau